MSGRREEIPPSRLARLIIRLYPARLRNEFGSELAQFIDERRAEPRFQRRWAGGVALILYLVLDSTRAVASEWGSRLLDGHLAPRPSLDLPSRSEDRMDTLLQDLRFAARTLVQRPAFTLTAVLTLMLGIGANTAIFSVVSAVLLRPLPYPRPDRLAVLWGARGSERQLLISIVDFKEWRARNHTFDDMGIVRSQSVNLTGSETPDRLIGSFVTASSLRILGAGLSVGRLFSDEETTEGTSQQVAVISNATWQTRFGGDPRILGKTLVLNGLPHVVIGVTAASFEDPFGASDVWLPITSAPNPAWFTRGVANVWAIGRLKPGITIDQGQRDISRVAAALASEYPVTNAGSDASVSLLKDNLVGNVRPTLLIVLSFVGVVLLIACANVANLQLARATTREREMSLRAALGAGRSRLVRQLLTESLFLSALGGFAGVVVAYWATKALVAAIPGGLPLFGSVDFEPRVLFFSAAITVAAGLLFGAVPAIHAARADLGDSLKMRSPNASAGGRLDARNAFVTIQLALCIVLLVGAGLLTRSLGQLQRVDPGFDPKNLFTAEFRLPAAKYRTPEQIAAFMQRAITGIRGVRGVRSAALVTGVPMSGNWSRASYVADGQPDPVDGNGPVAGVNTITDDYFRTMGIALVQGRDFTTGDRAETEPVAIVNEELAKQTWPGRSAIGQRLRIIGPPDIRVTVVGVVKGAKQLTLGEPPQAQLYGPISQQPGIFSTVVARTDGDPMALSSQIRDAIWTVDRDQPVWKMRTMEALLARDIAAPRFTMVLTGSFALLALVLATVGVYGVMSYAVTQRTREVGIRMALGAQHQQVIRMVLVRGMVVIGIATVLGMVASIAAGRLLQHQLFGVTATDPLTFIAVPVVLAAAALVACYIPARRAAGVDPMVALRSE